MYEPAMDRVRNGIIKYAEEAFYEMEKIARESNADTVDVTTKWVTERDDLQDGEYYPEAVIRVIRHEKDDSEPLSLQDVEDGAKITHAEVTIKCEESNEDSSD